MYNHFFYRLDNSHGRPIDSIANEYELDDSNYFGSVRSQSRSSSEKEREASYIDCTTYERHTIAHDQSEDCHMEMNESEKKE